MSAIAFDTLAYANRLKAAGVESHIAEAQSEATAEILHTLIIEQLVTKNDIKDLKIEMKEFIVKALLITVGLIGSLQTLFHFIR